MLTSEDKAILARAALVAHGDEADASIMRIMTARAVRYTAAGLTARTHTTDACVGLSTDEFVRITSECIAQNLR